MEFKRIKHGFELVDSRERPTLLKPGDSLIINRGSNQIAFCRGDKRQLLFHLREQYGGMNSTCSRTVVLDSQHDAIEFARIISAISGLDFYFNIHAGDDRDWLHKFTFIRRKN